MRLRAEEKKEERPAIAQSDVIGLRAYVWTVDTGDKGERAKSMAAVRHGIKSAQVYKGEQGKN